MANTVFMLPVFRIILFYSKDQLRFLTHAVRVVSASARGILPMMVGPVSHTSAKPTQFAMSSTAYEDVTECIIILHR